MKTVKTQEELLTGLTTEATVNELQEYFKEILELRGFNNQTAKDKMLLLTEEIGELAKALRKEDHSLTIDRTRIGNYQAIESEIADVGIVLISLCNVLNINLFESIIEKEKKNIERKWS
ncbi:NTP pyrophosphatase (non-canonical NTP hydrolase) [Anaerospora hongkongensis]|uniref:NTP pyrophosphatase (Non-canonical NTP hydrolase) n=1 Tax=Anaerospora hongkongensis TaxID=244830 RepID=A0A4R1PWK2_9FIRM|nr:MazG nucleotide pyrophosphohydrolase domain-containing protein [Anaerospora hongkongensis]TCL36784.1 NTP pyrophosphatase (non-canonical NTP hydrolase) [Anaerospora hongkongensis]